MMRARNAWLMALPLLIIPGSCAVVPAANEPVQAAAPAAPAPRPAPNYRAVIAVDGQLTQGGWLRGDVPQGTAQLTLNGNPVNIAPDDSFIIAFDRDAGPSAQLVASLANGQTITRDLDISPRAWNIEHVNVGRKPGSAPSEEYERRRAPELAQINAARRVRSDSQGWRQNFIWPVKGRLSGMFGSQRVYRGEPGSYHSGLDIATGESGTPFVAPADGVVTLAAETPFTLEGYLLMIDHGMGLNSAFLHCSKLAVRVGDVVKQGQYIGNIGSTGRSTGPHLHWGMKWNDARIDPILFTGPM